MVGIGLLFLLGRNLLEESRDVDGNPILFATVVLTLLYGAAIVGISYRWGYSSWRGARVRQDFEVQVIEYLDPCPTTSPAPKAALISTSEWAWMSASRHLTRQHGNK